MPRRDPVTLDSTKIGYGRVRMHLDDLGRPVVDVWTGRDFEEVMTVGAEEPVNVPNVAERIRRAINDAILCDRGLHRRGRGRGMRTMIVRCRRCQPG
jgi:nucleoside-diphosphate-sugar epimerase